MIAEYKIDSSLKYLELSSNKNYSLTVIIEISHTNKMTS